MRVARVAIAAFAVWAPLLSSAFADGGDAPRPPCVGAPSPAYALTGAKPAVRVWTKSDAVAWVPPLCVGWGENQRLKLIVALAGGFQHEGGAEDLLARFGAVSAMRGLRYWSTTEKTWSVLITDAVALEGTDGNGGRPDFTPKEMKRGADLFFSQQDNRSSGPVVYRMRVLERGPDGLAITTENAGPVRAFGVTLFPLGSLRATYFLEKLGPRIWSFYGISAVGQNASSLAGLGEASYVNRAAALYRHLIRIPPDRDPPLAP